LILAQDLQRGEGAEHFVFVYPLPVCFNLHFFCFQGFPICSLLGHLDFFLSLEGSLPGQLGFLFGSFKQIFVLLDLFLHLNSLPLFFLVSFLICCLEGTLVLLHLFHLHLHLLHPLFSLLHLLFSLPLLLLHLVLELLRVLLFLLFYSRFFLFGSTFFLLQLLVLYL